MKNVVSEITAKIVEEVKNKLKLLVSSKNNIKFYNEFENEQEVDLETIREAANLKTEIDMLESKLKQIRSKYEPLRKKVLAMLPGEKQDKVEIFVDGILIKKFSQNRGGNQLDQDKIMELARKKKILSKITKTVRVVDEEKLLYAIHEGHITYDEYLSCLTEGKVVEVLDVCKKVYENEPPKNIVYLEDSFKLQ